MEVANVEAVPKRGAGAVAQLEDLELADHVAGRLARIVEIALDLLDDVALGQQANCPGNIDRLLAGPALGVDAGVGDQPDRAPQLRSRACRTRE